MKASPEEIIIMNNNSAGIISKVEEIHQRAMAHTKIGNLDSAVSLYSEAINILPTTELLISRAEIFEQQNESNLAFDDYTKSLKLNPSKDEEIVARLGRLRLADHIYGGIYSSPSTRYSWEDFDKDYYWLHEHTEGYERGKVIFTYINSWDYLALDSLTIPAVDRVREGEEMVLLIDEAINLGFNNAETYYLRSFGNKVASNYGIALHDIDKAISLKASEERRVEYLCHRAEILVEMKDFHEAYKTLEEAKKIDKTAVRDCLSLGTYNIGEDILCLCGLEKKFYGEDNIRREPISSIIKLLLLWYSKDTSSFRIDNKGNPIEVKTVLDEIINKHSGFVSSLLRLLNDEERSTIKNINTEYIFKIRLPTLRVALP